jgi:hypothetical protein
LERRSLREWLNEVWRGEEAVWQEERVSWHARESREVNARCLRARVERESSREMRTRSLRSNSEGRSLLRWRVV